MMNTHKHITACLLLLMGIQVFIHADPPVNKSFFGGVAVKGYDVVAYFTKGVAIKGHKEHRTDWRNAEWRFANARHLNMFKAHPETYAPQYGGYCAWAMAEGDTAPIDPQAWRIVEGKLYLNYNAKIQSRWEQDISGFIKQADRAWKNNFTEQ